MPTALVEIDPEDLARRATTAAQAWAPGCKIRDAVPLTGGASSLTFTSHVDGGPPDHERVVLKVAPPGLAPVRNRDIARQARVMRALADAPGVRVPMVLFEDDGEPPQVPPLHAMNVVIGECAEPILQPNAPDPLSDTADRALAAAAMLAALHRVDPVAVGLAELPVSLEGEITRWSRALSTVDENLNARYLEAEQLLVGTMPKAHPPSICHGDYRLGNMLCAGGAVNALIDWEIWSLSDPRLDLAWFLFFTEEANHPMAMNRGPTGMPSADELLAAYVEARGAQPVDFGWFHCLIKYKEAAATALLLKRMVKSGTTLNGSETWASAIPALTAACIEGLTSLQ